MRLELTREDLLVELANHYKTRGALSDPKLVPSICQICMFGLIVFCFMAYQSLKVI